MSDQLPPPPRRPAPDALRNRIESELTQAQRRHLSAAPVMILVAAVAVVVAAVLGVNAYRQPMTAEPATTVAPVTPSTPAPPSTTPSTNSSTTPSAGASTSGTSAGPATLDLDARALSDRVAVAASRTCYAEAAKADRPPSSAQVAYARYDRWAGLNGPGWNQSKVLIERQPGVGSWVCVNDLSEQVPDDADRLTSAVPVWEVENYGGGIGACTGRTSGTWQYDELFQVGEDVATARVRLVAGGHTSPWQTTTPIGGYAHFTIGLLGEDAWTKSLTAEYEFLDRDGKPLKAQPYGPRGTKTTTRISSDVSTCADMRKYDADSNDPFEPPTSVKAAVKACTDLAGTADPDLDLTGWELALENSEAKTWGGVLRKGDQRFACSLAPTREVSRAVADKPSTAESSFWFAVNPIAATEGTSFWAGGRVPDDVTAITYELPGNVTVPAKITDDGHWMAMYHVDGKDLDTPEHVSDWKPVRVTITRKSGAPITYTIPFTDSTMCNQASHGC